MKRSGWRTAARWTLGIWAAAIWTGASAEEPGAPATAPAHIAGTSASAGDGAASFRMVVDRPFALVLRHMETGTLVRLGLINNSS